jgi:glutathione synthase/RimK-type ligase-like ATP-grasp enzyme
VILVISSVNDAHASAVLGELRRLGAEARLLDLSLFPSQMQLTMQYDSVNRRAFWLKLPGDEHLDLADCRVIWWRRPQSFVLPPTIVQEAHRVFALNEIQEAFSGLWQAVDAFWVNPPHCDTMAHRKVYQLRVAQEVGLAIPRTLITSDPEEARQFAATQGYERTIYKAFSATPADWRETRLLRSEEIAQLDNVRYAPVIFQEYIEAQYDLRITIVGQSIFPAAIFSQQTAYKVDFRMDIANARIEPVALPVAVEAHLFDVMEKLGLVYGAIDMRLTPDGRYVFLEINPAGQWLFVEQHSHQPITASMATLLASRDAQGASEYTGSERPII